MHSHAHQFATKKTKELFFSSNISVELLHYYDCVIFLELYDHKNHFFTIFSNLNKVHHAL